MSVKAKIEAIIYATEEPVTLNQLASLLKDAVLSEMHAEEEARLALNETVADTRIAETNEDLPDSETFIEDEGALRSAESEADAANQGQPYLRDAEQVRPDELTKEQNSALEKQRLQEVKSRLSALIGELISEYSASNRGMEIRQIAGGYRMATKPEHHDVVVNFARSLKPPVRLSLQALETLAVIAYKQPVTVPEISEIRGVDSAGVIATLLDRKLVTTSGRKQVIGRPILYKTTKEFLMRFGLKDLAELPSVEEFEKLGDPQAEMFAAPAQPTVATNPGSEDAEPVTEAVAELATEANREQMPTAALEDQATEETFEPVTEGDPHLVATENRETETDVVSDPTAGEK